MDFEINNQASQNLQMMPIYFLVTAIVRNIINQAYKR